MDRDCKTAYARYGHGGDDEDTDKPKDKKVVCTDSALHGGFHLLPTAFLRAVHGDCDISVLLPLF